MSAPQSLPCVRLGRTWDHQQGLTLVEILVTVVILSIGLLGIAALHTLSLRNNYDAYMRSQATTLIHDMLDRMRSNPMAARDDLYNTTLGAKITLGSSPTLAEQDLAAWKTALDTTLPAGDGAISTALVGGHKLFTITVEWGERKNKSDDSDRVQFQISTEI